MQPHLSETERELNGVYHNLFTVFKLQSHEEFYNFTRMTVQQFDKILKLIEPHLTSNFPSKMRKPLPAELKIAAFLKYVKDC